MSKPTSKVDALLILLNDARQQRLTKAGYRRVLAAEKFLGLDESERIEVERWLEYRNALNQLTVEMG